MIDVLSPDEKIALINRDTINWNQMSEIERKDAASYLLKVLEELKK